MKEYLVSRTWKFKVLTILAIAATLSLGVYMYRGKNITLQLDDKVTEIVTYANTVEEFIQKEDIPFKKGGYISAALDNKLEKDMHIIIKNPKPYIISINGMLGDVTSIHTRVDKILEENNIILQGLDYTIPEMHKEINPGDTIEVYRVRELVESVEEEIPFAVDERKVRHLDKGEKKVIQKGKNGLRKIDYKKIFINGKLETTTVVNEVVVQEPDTEIVEIGIREKVINTPTRGKTNYRDTMVMTATAYDLSYASTGKRPGDKYYGITASGTKARPGVVAVDPRVIPLGTKLYIESTDGTKDYGFAIAEDKGGAIKGNKIDLFFETASQVRNFGRRKVKVYILN